MIHPEFGRARAVFVSQQAWISIFGNVEIFVLLSFTSIRSVSRKEHIKTEKNARSRCAVLFSFLEVYLLAVVKGQRILSDSFASGTSLSRFTSAPVSLC